MPLIGIPSELLAAGGWAVAASLAVGFLALMITEVIVTGRSKKASDRRAERFLTQLEKNTELGEKYSGQIDALIKILARKVKL